MMPVSLYFRVVKIRCRLTLWVHTSVKRFATDVVGPKVREMDENEQMDPQVIKGLFEQGVRYIPSHLYPRARCQQLMHATCSLWVSRLAATTAALSPHSRPPSLPSRSLRRSTRQCLCFATYTTRS